ncbi:MAG TPA: Gfo/Idh/MocA family oxidoreductase [Candidatus Acidoferrales bacterium]|nr:Gfo/Idh/MocA family oxidoreductase [Candidatus Acidoferrales bacterium]
MSKRYRIGIVGAGFGVAAHLPALTAHPRFDVVALASPRSAARIAAERAIAAFPSCREMLAGCELDAVTVASPPFAHERDVEDVLRAGKHVICEKPFALNLDSAERMLEASRAAGTACGVAHEFRFVPQIAALRELVANHHLDPVRNLEITALRAFLRRHDARTRGWWFDRKLGGGLAGALMSHVVDMANWLTGERPRRTSGFVRTANRRRRDDDGEFVSTVDDGAFALVEYPGGAVGRLSADATTSAGGFTCAVHGESRTAVASGPSMTQMGLYSIDADETSELDCKPSPYAALSSVNPNVPYLAELYDEFVKAIEGTANGLPTFEEAVVTQGVLAAIGFEIPSPRAV